MRFAVLFFIVLLGLAALFLFGQPGGPGDAGGPPEPVGIAPAEPAAAATTLPEASLEVVAPPPSATEDLGPAPEAMTDRALELDFSHSTLVDFHGIVMLQPKGQTPYPAIRGTVEIAILNRGQMVPMTIEIQQGQFSVELPERCRIRVDGGRLEDQTVRFLGFDGPRTLDHTLPYALVGEPIPVNQLRVFEGTQGIPLPSVTIRQADDATTALSQGEAAVGQLLLEDVASPIELPFIDSDHPIWLHVSAEGYAATAVLVNPTEPATKDVTLWPSAQLTVRVTGPGRKKLKALILHRMEPALDGKEPSKRHFATFGMRTPGMTTDPDATIFTLVGLPALPLRLEARGLDERGRESLIGTAAVELGPSETKTVELRVKTE